MIRLPGYDAWRLASPPEPTDEDTTRLDEEVRSGSYPPCDTCGGNLTQVDRLALSPAEAWEYADLGGSLCTPCDEGDTTCHACGSSEPGPALQVYQSPSGDESFNLCEHCQ